MMRDPLYYGHVLSKNIHIRLTVKENLHRKREQERRQYDYLIRQTMECLLYHAITNVVQ